MKIQLRHHSELGTMPLISKRTLRVFMLFCLVTPSISTAQQYSYPFRIGDILTYLVHNPQTGKVPTISYSIVSASPREGNTDGNNDTVMITNIGVVTINSRGILTEIYPDTSAWWVTELWPTSPPMTNTFHLYRTRSVTIRDSSLHRVTRRFDTTILGREVSVFTIDNRITIADYFGLIQRIDTVGTRVDTISLSSAVIDGTPYNRDERSWRFMPLCVGNEYHYRTISTASLGLPDTVYTSLKLLRDTIILGYRYLIGEFRDSKNQQVVYSHRREGDEGIYILNRDNNTEDLILRYKASVGSSFREPPLYYSVTVIDTSNEFVFGSQRRVHTTLGDSYAIRRYAEGIGMIYEKYVGPGFSHPTTELLSAHICGQTYQLPLAVEDQAQPASFSLSQNFPNPVLQSTTIRYRLSAGGHVRMDIYDLLGQKAATLVDEKKLSGEHVLQFDIDRLNPALNQGVYFYRLRVGNKDIVKMMVILR